MNPQLMDVNFVSCLQMLSSIDRGCPVANFLSLIPKLIASITFWGVVRKLELHHVQAYMRDDFWFKKWQTIFEEYSRPVLVNFWLKILSRLNKNMQLSFTTISHIYKQY